MTPRQTKLIVSKRMKSQQKNTAVFFSPMPPSSVEVVRNCMRIPEVAMNMARAREIFKRYNIPAPLWLWGLIDNTDFQSPANKSLISFVLSMGLYERLTHLLYRPRFLIGSSPALLVCARVRTFERTLIKIFFDQMDMSADDSVSEKALKSSSVKRLHSRVARKQSSPKKNPYSSLLKKVWINHSPLRIYKNRRDFQAYFSLQYFSTDTHDMLGKLKQKYGITNCISILPVTGLNNRQLLAPSVKFENFIAKDHDLHWLWPVLKLHKMKTIKPKLSHVSFH